MEEKKVTINYPTHKVFFLIILNLPLLHRTKIENNIFEEFRIVTDFIRLVEYLVSVII